MNNNNIEDFMFLSGKDEAGIRHYKQTIPVNIYHFYMTEVIEGVDRYIHMINVMKTAESHDTIFIYLNTPGGILSTAVQIVSAMAQCNATVVTCMEGEVCSAGTLIFLAGGRHIVNPNTTLMIHNYSGGMFGKGHEISSQVKYVERYMEQLLKSTYAGFLTPDEIDLVVGGKDYWFDSDEVITRLEARNAILDAQEEELADSANDVVEAVVQAIGEKAVTEKKDKANGKKPKKAPAKKRTT